MNKKSLTDARSYLATARNIAEALPNIQRYDRQVIVVKFGGNAMENQQTLERFARDVALVRQCGVRPILVHGGAPQISAMLKKSSLESQFVEGLRVTDQDTIEIVEMVLSGSVNKKIVAAINMQGARAVGLSGKDANLLVCRKTKKQIWDQTAKKNKYLDLGLVGEPVKTNTAILQDLLASENVPVVSPIGISEEGETLNVNGDIAAGVIAASIKAKRLLLLTDVDGVRDESGEIIGEITPEAAEQLIERGVISGGMIPKVRTALDAIQNGAEAAVILNGKAPHALLLELFTNRGAGTLFRRKSKS